MITFALRYFVSFFAFTVTQLAWRSSSSSSFTLQLIVNINHYEKIRKAITSAVHMGYIAGPCAVRPPGPVVITCPRYATLPTTVGECRATVDTSSTGKATAMNYTSCLSLPTSLVASVPYNNGTLALGANTLTWQAVDNDSGLTATCQQIVTVEGELACNSWPLSGCAEPVYTTGQAL